MCSSTVDITRKSDRLNFFFAEITGSDFWREIVGICYVHHHDSRATGSKNLRTIDYL